MNIVQKHGINFMKRMRSFQGNVIGVIGFPKGTFKIEEFRFGS